MTMSITKEPINTRTKVKESKDVGIKTHYVGKRVVQDMETGEIMELEYVEKKVPYGNIKRGWRRVYLEHFMELIAGLYSAGRKIDVVEFILDNLNSENQLTMSQAQVIRASHISKPVVIETFQYLIANDFMKKQGSIYAINPKFICAFGSDKKNATIAVKYSCDNG